ncbi:diguanylate cyclase [Marinicella sp. S1101]|uniref:ligand-binding sensor domain-containing diguanylate cyclase n=1 Tax=Marinicella marina TaxID=2996016 RepID=UPI002260B987|nr:ligand-binding sensor domain-containing diguanylate cyclase [Marinicella marina]MCX7553443.1 diguanylate cyclase [Marinicella marina]MDJ1140067.1 diguanylate cyclase [Marinicella marina]
MASVPEEWNTIQLQVEDGLPQSTVYSVVQDQSGFIWFGTTSGVSRYDGYEFLNLTHDGADPNTLSNNNAGNLYLDSQNILWVGTFGGGLNAIDIDDNKIIRFPYSSQEAENMISENVQTFYEDKDGVLWIGTGTGLYSFFEGVFEHFDVHGKKSGELLHNRIWDIHSAGDNNLWLGTSNGLFHFDTSSKQFSHHKLPTELIFDITSTQFRTIYTQSGLVWIGSSSGLYSFNPSNESFGFHGSNDQFIKVNDIERLNESQLLIASMAGVYLFDTDNNSFVTDASGQQWRAYQFADIRDIFIDDTKIMWLASRNSGVYKVDSTGGLFSYHKNLMPLDDANEKAEKIWTFAETNNQELLLATSDTVLKRTSVRDYQRIGTTSSESIPGIIRDIIKASDGGFWVGGSDGLYYLDQQANVAEIVAEPFQLAGMDPTDVFSVYETNSGEIWLALYNVGVLRWRPAQQNAILYQSIQGQALTDLNLINLLEDSQGRIWIASSLVGLIQFDLPNDQWRLFAHDFSDLNSLSSNRIKDVHEDTQGRIWVATARGLNLFRPESDNFVRYAQSDGLLDDNINIILEDSKQNIWLGHRYGLSKLNAQENSFSSYVFKQSIRKGGTVTHSGFIDANDVIYLGSTHGYYEFNPNNNLQSLVYQPELNVTELKVNNKDIMTPALTIDQTEFELNHNDQSIQFKFAVSDYLAPEQIKYAYRLKGVNDEWIDISKDRYVELKALKPGQYQLDIRAGNNNDSWNEKNISYQLSVKPAWWNQTWIKVLFFIGLIVLAYAIHFRRTRAIRKQNLILEREVSKRTEELQGLNVKLEKAANTDFLTNLPNRLAFISEVNAKSEQAKFIGHLVLADIDYFKSINDKYGHSAGDELLKSVARDLQNNMAAGDMIARWGGEEFILLLNESDAQAATSMIEALRQKMASGSYLYENNQLQISLTFGMCQFNSEMDLIDAINCADKALYEGKTKGRNMTVYAR